ncbi:MAG: Hsp20/alpha crystallin family protein [Chloroflexi bacterium]|nr:Hsp20/alpha crystallin family protein [Chloroflexota bacterium]
MILQMRHPFMELESIRQAMDRVFEDPFRFSRSVAASARSTGVDMYETPEELVVRAELPGVKPSDAEITIERGRLTIRAKRQEDEEAERKAVRWFYRDLWTVDYAATVMLPDSLVVDQAKATYENGILTLRIPKAEGAKPKQIKISVSGKPAGK